MYFIFILFFSECFAAGKLCLQSSRTHQLWITAQWNYYPGLSPSEQHSHGHSETTEQPLDCCRLCQAAEARRERKQKRGCRAGLLARLRKQPNKPPLTSIFLANARSFVNKMDEMDLQLAKNFMRDCSVMVITETWLPDTAVQLTGRTIHRQDRSKDSGRQGEKDSVYMCTTPGVSGSRITHSHCSTDIQVLSVMCRPFYLP